MRTPLAFIIVSAVCTTGCQREEREAARSARGCLADQIASMPNGIGGAPPRALDKPYESNAYNLSEGKRLFLASRNDERQTRLAEIARQLPCGSIRDQPPSIRTKAESMISRLAGIADL
jgi:hypothetical protein